ncbi:MAG: acyl--CoA ligase [Desulfobacula sp.]|jgi:long-chain acyl-CoA synthetase|uniref:class I adenylate-forming enzyme family protein n=1 Tax=Desulfobacula sp. TaxID=2593537 RepID=UPI001DF86113|nr:acyl--CoA ligase [Desulfobacula sp.]MBT3486363.1 acyl--CoA ligase [Desulfobacula sp.]MBT3804557.1 acyl--CoA ligase [Desulfobacula sp.]MBT4026288.1 acyl--CoA ligase [Desulfobacula sp.]MBT4199946.1 acyl--CoA ligase [Desulfobacula sp.]
MKILKENNIFSAFNSIADQYPEKTAVIYLGTKFSYHSLKVMAEKFAAALLDLDVKSGDKIMIYIPNSIQWVVSFLAVQRIGCVCVPITPIYTPHDLDYIANDSSVSVIICADTNFGYVQKVLGTTGIKRTIYVRMGDLLPFWKQTFGRLYNIIPKGNVATGEHIYSLKRLLSKYKEPNLPPLEDDPDKTAQILYTGGTTKFPKGVPMSHALFLVSAIEQILTSEPIIPPSENIILGNAPLFHILGQTCSLATLLVGGALLVQPKINMDATFEAIYRFKVRSMIGVPALYRMMLEHDRLDQYDLSSVDYWYSAGDVLPVEVGRRWQEKFGKCIYQGYGATETCGGVVMCPVDIENPPKSVGRLVPSKKIMIVDPVMNPQKPGDPGELLVHSKEMVTSYLNKKEETQKSFVTINGKTWYRTADIMKMDEDGNLYFVDRTVDTIKHKGYRVSASEIESVLQEHPAVIGTCVIGVPDEKVGERIKAYVVLKEDIKGITGYELIKWCRKTLVSYKIPQYIEFRDMLPKSKVGKLLRREIRSEEARRADG